MVEYNLEEVLSGNVDSVIAKFGELDDGKLAQLAKLEAAGGDRATLTAAIEREQATRKEAAAANDAKVADAAAKAKAAGGARTYTQAEVDAINAEHATQIANMEAAHKRALDAAKAEKAPRAPAKAHKAAKPRKLSLAMTAAGSALRVAFGDENDMSIAALPELEFGSADFEKVPGGQVTLNRAIDFPETTPGTTIHSVWLTDDDGVGVGVSRMVQPFPVGGGAAATIPAKFLAFTGGLTVETGQRPEAH